MIHETTPERRTEKIERFCRNICKNEIIEVPVLPTEFAVMNECFPNVQKQVEVAGGEAVNGWAIWQWRNITITAEAHCVWKNMAGELVDITPHNLGERSIFFLPDNAVSYNGKSIPSKRVALTESELVREFISLIDEKDRLACETPVGEQYHLPKKMFSRIVELQMQFCGKSGRNDKCVCGSGIKYKYCCGKYE